MGQCFATYDFLGGGACQFGVGKAGELRQRDAGMAAGFYQFQERQEGPDRVGKLRNKLGISPVAGKLLQELVDAERRTGGGGEHVGGDLALVADDAVAAGSAALGQTLDGHADQVADRLRLVGIGGGDAHRESDADALLR